MPLKFSTEEGRGKGLRLLAASSGVGGPLTAVVLWNGRNALVPPGDDCSSASQRQGAVRLVKHRGEAPFFLSPSARQRGSVLLEKLEKQPKAEPRIPRDERGVLPLISLLFLFFLERRGIVAV